jgi:hypothetical protein
MDEFDKIRGDFRLPPFVVKMAVNRFVTTAMSFSDPATFWDKTVLVCEGVNCARAVSFTAGFSATGVSCCVGSGCFGGGFFAKNTCQARITIRDRTMARKVLLSI